jgi:superfamily I DNA/RNA helicase
VDKDVASCTGRTLRENELQRAIVNAVNDILNRKDAVIAVLEKNVSDTLNNGASSRIADIDQELDKLQHELLAENVDKAAVQEIGNTILALREEKQTLMEKIARNRKAQDRVTEMVKYLNEQDRIINEYSEALVRRLIERISVYDDRVVVKFKSGLETAVWM